MKKNSATKNKNKRTRINNLQTKNLEGYKIQNNSLLLTFAICQFAWCFSFGRTSFNVMANS